MLCRPEPEQEACECPCECPIAASHTSLCVAEEQQESTGLCPPPYEEGWSPSSAFAPDEVSGGRKNLPSCVDPRCSERMDGRYV